MITADDANKVAQLMAQTDTHGAEPLAIPEQQAPTVQLTAAQVRRVHDEIAAVVTVADAAIETLRELCGPEPGDFASSLKVRLNMGAGYFRSCAADIEDAWRKRNVRAKQKAQ